MRYQEDERVRRGEINSIRDCRDCQSQRGWKTTRDSIGRKRCRCAIDLAIAPLLNLLARYIVALNTFYSHALAPDRAFSARCERVVEDLVTLF